MIIMIIMIFLIILTQTKIYQMIIQINVLNVQLKIVKVVIII